MAVSTFNSTSNMETALDEITLGLDVAVGVQYNASVPWKAPYPYLLLASSIFFKFLNVSESKKITTQNKSIALMKP